MFHTSVLRLGKRELEIMNIVWDMGEATVQDVCDRLRRTAAYSTIMTMMRRLEDKGVLQHRISDRTFIYRPQIPRDHIRSSIIDEIRNLLFGGSSALLVSSMLDAGTMTADDLASLRGLLERTEAKGKQDA